MQVHGGKDDTGKHLVGPFLRLQIGRWPQRIAIGLLIKLTEKRKKQKGPQNRPISVNQLWYREEVVRCTQYKPVHPREKEDSMTS